MAVFGQLVPGKTVLGMDGIPAQHPCTQSFQGALVSRVVSFKLILSIASVHHSLPYLPSCVLLPQGTILYGDLICQWLVHPMQAVSFRVNHKTVKYQQVTVVRNFLR